MVDVPQPTFILAKPLRLATQNNRPMYQGVLQLLAGPHRVEGGWWDRTTLAGDGRSEGMDEPAQETTRHIARDYWVAVSEYAGVLWIFQMRLAKEETAWFLHGTFA